MRSSWSVCEVEDCQTEQEGGDGVTGLFHCGLILHTFEVAARSAFSSGGLLCHTGLAETSIVLLIV